MPIDGLPHPSRNHLIHEPTVATPLRTSYSPPTTPVSYPPPYAAPHPHPHQAPILPHPPNPPHPSYDMSEHMYPGATLPPQQMLQPPMYHVDQYGTFMQHHASTFFLALSFDPEKAVPGTLVDIQPVINDFISKIMNWPLLKAGMAIVVEVSHMNDNILTVYE